MTFSFDAEQQALAETVDAVLSRHCTTDVVRAAGDDPAVARDLWQRLADLDIPALSVPEHAGGLGLGPVEIVAVAEAAGRYAPPVPLVATIGAFVPLVSAAGGDTDEALSVLERVVAGAPATVAIVADPGRPAPTLRDGRLTATVDGVPHGTLAELVALPAVDDGGQPRLVVAAPEALGLRTERSMDHSAPMGRIQLCDQAIEGALVLHGDPSPGLAPTYTSAAAELVSLSGQLVAIAVEYAGEREQFGRKIGSFQAVKHQLVDAHMAVERARSLVRHAAVLAAAADPGAALASHLAKAAASEAATRSARTAVQVHGGMGITLEHDVSLLYLRARMGSALLGDAEAHYALAAAERLGAAT